MKDDSCALSSWIPDTEVPSARRASVSRCRSSAVTLVSDAGGVLGPREDPHSIATELRPLSELTVKGYFWRGGARASETGLEG